MVRAFIVFDSRRSALTADIVYSALVLITLSVLGLIGYYLVKDLDFRTGSSFGPEDVIPWIITIIFAVLPVVAVLWTLILILMGLLWAPFAAVICAVIAFRRGLNPWFYAWKGMGHSVQLFLPWFYLVKRMRGRSFHRRTVVGNYASLYAVWLFGPIIGGLVVIAAAFEEPGVESYLLTMIIMLTQTAMNIFMSIRSIRGVIQGRSSGICVGGRDNNVLTDDMLTDDAYVKPFRFLLVGNLTLLAAAGLTWAVW